MLRKTRRDCRRIDSAPVPRVKFQGLLLSSLAPSAKNLPFVSHFALKGCCQDSKQARIDVPLRTCNIMPNDVAGKLTSLLYIRRFLGYISAHNPASLTDIRLWFSSDYPSKYRNGKYLIIRHDCFLAHQLPLNIQHRPTVRHYRI
jgi:hypothetical protein